MRNIKFDKYYYRFTFMVRERRQKSGTQSDDKLLTKMSSKISFPSLNVAGLADITYKFVTRWSCVKPVGGFVRIKHFFKATLKLKFHAREHVVWQRMESFRDQWVSLKILDVTGIPFLIAASSAPRWFAFQDGVWEILLC